MKAVLVILLLLSNLSQAGVMRDSYLQSPLLIGQGTLHFLWWEVYDIKLFTNNTSFSWEYPFLLEFDYKREVKKEDVMQSTLKELRRQQAVSEKDTLKWQKYLDQTFQSVQVGTRAILYWDPEGKITFHYERSNPEVIQDGNFARAFFNIWLGEETSQPQLRKNLINE